MEKDPLIPKTGKTKSGKYQESSIGTSSRHSTSQKSSRFQATGSRKSYAGSSMGTSHSSRRPTMPVPELPYNIVRVRVVTSIVIILAGMGFFPMTVLISQYLFNRLVKEALVRSNFTFVDFNEIQAESTRKIQRYTYTQCVPALVSSLLVGAYSDFIGRRVTLLLPLLGQVIKTIIIALIVRFDLDYSFFYLGYGIDGLLGSWFVALTAIYSIAADTNFHKNQRLLWIMISGGLANVACSVSLMINGTIIEEVGYSRASQVLTGYVTLSFAVPLILLPETLPPTESTPVNPWKSIRRVFAIFTTEGAVKHRLTLVTLLIMFFFSVINDIGCPSIDVLYQMSPPFRFSSEQVGFYACLKIGGQAFFGMFLMKGFQQCLKAEHIGMLASLFQTGMYVMESVVNTTWQMMLVPAVGIPGCLIAPTVRGIMSVLAGPDHQGAIFSSVAVAEVLSTIASNSIFNEVYARTVSYYSGAVYVTMASFATAPFLLFFVYFRLYDFGNHEYYYEEYVDVPPEFVGSGSISMSISMSASYAREMRESQKKRDEEVAIENLKTNSIEFDIGHRL